MKHPVTQHIINIAFIVAVLGAIVGFCALGSYILQLD